MFGIIGAVGDERERVATHWWSEIVSPMLYISEERLPMGTTVACTGFINKNRMHF